MRIFQIGFNNCGTTALNHLFQASGIMSLHGTGRYWREKGHPAVQGRNVQLAIHRNISAGRPAVYGFDDFRAFFGMEFSQGGLQIENFRRFALLAEEYPSAKFILNTRDTDRWLQDRIDRQGGRYLQWAMDRTGMSLKGVLNLWADDFHRHHDMVREHFRADPDRLMEFDVDSGSVKDLIKFARSANMRLSSRHWKRARVSDHWQIPDRFRAA
ncbi:sulfotransferase [Pseudoruegeria sp. HB172150]|uniref:sulfotransferase n=1 Tax=Pseudoruegeria sp. HB172150 TaxID=2721164 RepID=UPI001555BC60|nr:sulfotransferase [Pseudoruegeria sp. HB172150]